MAGSTTRSWAEYSKWTVNIARNLFANMPTISAAEDTALRTALKAFYNPVDGTGTRSWLKQPFNKKSEVEYRNASPTTPGDIDSEPVRALVEMLEVVGRDIKRIPMTTAESVLLDTLIAATGIRRLGTGATFGNVSGDTRD